MFILLEARRLIEARPSVLTAMYPWQNLWNCFTLQLNMLHFVAIFSVLQNNLDYNCNYLYLDLLILIPIFFTILMNFFSSRQKCEHLLCRKCWMMNLTSLYNFSLLSNSVSCREKTSPVIVYISSSVIFRSLCCRVPTIPSNTQINQTWRCWTF